MRAKPYKCATETCQTLLSGVGQRCGTPKRYCNHCLIQRKKIREYSNYHEKKVRHMIKV